MNVRFVVVIALLFSSVMFSQSKTLIDFKEAILSLNFSDANENAIHLDKGAVLPYFTYLTYFRKNAGQDPIVDAQRKNVIENSKSPQDSLMYNLSLGTYYLYNSPSNEKAFELLSHAYHQANTKKLTEIRKIILVSLMELYAAEMIQSSEDYRDYLKEYQEIITTDVELAWCHINYVKYQSKSLDPSAEFNFKQAYQDLNNFFEASTTLENLQSYHYHYQGLYLRVNKELKKSKEAYLKSIEYARGKKYLKYIKYVDYIHLCLIESIQENYPAAKHNLEQARKYYNISDTIRSEFIQNRFTAVYYYSRIKQFDSAYSYLLKSITNEQQLDFRNNTLKISALNVQLGTAEKEKQILIEQENKKRNRNIAIGLGGGLIAVSLIGFLLFKNSKRKQRIAEQQREIEIQKTEKLLRDQELTTIDAMIEGQEKERQRLASDLHDSVGATLSAAKLQFDHLSKNKDKLDQLDELFGKTGKLLEDAYTEVRSMAHIKNSGVLAKNGLLPAIQKLAKNASGTNKLKIEVQDFGLDDRLENSLEITVFRIIQELVTNIIKHANASEASISVTQHEDSLNIIVEDDGKGFNPMMAVKSDEGMGLDSIERRIEHLEGAMEVDSSEGNGTTIVIDLPL